MIIPKLVLVIYLEDNFKSSKVSEDKNKYKNH